MEETRPGLFFPIEEDENGTHILNAKDLCLIAHLDKLWQAGIDSFKIEGRAKSSYYVAVVTNTYQMALQAFGRKEKLPSWLLEEVDKVSHRKYHTGFLFGRPKQGTCSKNGGYIRNWDVAAWVEGYEDGCLICRLRNRFAVGDTLEILQPHKPPETFRVTHMYDENHLPLQSAVHAMMTVYLPFPNRLPEGSLFRKQHQEGNG